MAKSNINARKSSPFGDEKAFIVLFALKHKYKNSVDIFIFKPYFANLLLITPERFEKRYKDFQKKPNAPFCRSSFSYIDCPYFHLEKKFELSSDVLSYKLFFIDKKESVLFVYFLDQDRKKWNEMLKSLNLDKEVRNMYEKMSEEIKNKNLHKDPILFEKEFKRIYNFPQDANICPLAAKFIEIENIKPVIGKILGTVLNVTSSDLIGFVMPNTPQCKNIFSEELRNLFYSTKEVYTWMEKEFGLRGYLK